MGFFDFVKKIHDPLNLFGFNPSGAEQDLKRLSSAGFESSDIQRFLPEQLRAGTTGPILGAGISGLGELIQRPGGLSPNVSQAIAPRLAMESEAIAQNFRGIQQQQAGAAARGNLPVSIRAALERALEVSQERAQRGARREALGESEQLRRQDLQQVFQLIEALNQFIGTRLGTSTSALGALSQAQGQRQAGGLAALGSIFGSISGSKFKHNIKPVQEEDILAAIESLPVYEWSYKGENIRHMGPMAEDFLATFGLGDNPERLPFVDTTGTMMAAIKAISKKVKRLEAVSG